MRRTQNWSENTGKQMSGQPTKGQALSGDIPHGPPLHIPTKREARHKDVCKCVL